VTIKRINDDDDDDDDENERRHFVVVTYFNAFDLNKSKCFTAFGYCVVGLPCRKFGTRAGFSWWKSWGPAQINCGDH